jgi:uncharacterized protein
MRLVRACITGLLVLALASFAALPSVVALALDFPALSGRVVDQAGVLTEMDRIELAARSKDLEERSGIQLVVATVPSLQGSDIETYANQLFRAWKLGQADKNNGVLLLVAPAERKVRIEVGYGLEGTLTDALASTIISGAVVPRFKSGDLPGGIEGGVNGIIAVLSGDSSQWQPQPVAYTTQPRWFGEYVIMAIVLSFTLVVFVLFIVGLIKNILHPPPRGHYVKRGKRWVYVAPRGASANSSSWSGSDSSSSSSSSSSSGGFSGGGGSSGGGGASGSW